MFGRLIRPFKKRYDKYAGKVGGFARPVWNATMNLLGKLPNPKAFAGSEDLGDESENGEESTNKSLLGRLKNFKKSLKEMSDVQKLILLTIAVVLPAGIFLAVTLAKLISKDKSK